MTLPKEAEKSEEKGLGFQEDTTAQPEASEPAEPAKTIYLAGAWLFRRPFKRLAWQVEPSRTGRNWRIM